MTYGLGVTALFLAAIGLALAGADALVRFLTRGGDEQ